MPHPFISLCAGASAGACIRWLLGLSLNAVYPAMPLGTLVANLAGGYLIGAAVSVFALFPAIGAQWGVAVVTGFLGSLTTFSSFSYEVAALIQAGRLCAAGGVITAHVAGSLTMTFMGIGTVMLLRPAA